MTKIRIELDDQEFVSLVVVLEQYLTMAANNPTTKLAFEDPAGKVAVNHLKSVSNLHKRLNAMLNL